MNEENNTIPEFEQSNSSTESKNSQPTHPNPKKPFPTKLVAIIAAVGVIAIIGIVALLPKTKPSENPQTPSEPSCNHQWIEADCLYPKTCRICQETSGTAKGHSFINATCTEPKTCQNCNETNGVALGHSWKDATCTTPRTCSVCKKTEGDISYEHSYQNGKCVTCNTIDPKAEEFEKADIAYFYLTIAHELCSEIMDSIYGAWYFAIYEADDYYMFSSCLRAFCSEANLSQDDVKNAIDKVLQKAGFTDIDDDWRCVAMQVPSYAVAIVVQVYTDYETYYSIDTNLSNAKDALKSVTNNYADYTGYHTLKSYYSEISSYADFCSSPTGSFNQLKTTVETYETNLRNYKSDLSFIFE